MIIRWMDYSDKELVEIIIKEIKRIGIEDTLEKKKYMELYNPTNAPSVATIQRRFLNWNNFIDKHTDLNPQYRFWKDISDEVLLDRFEKELERIGKVSYSEYVKKYNKKISPSLSTIEKRFGSYNKALTKLNYKTVRNSTWTDLSKEELTKIIQTELIRLNILGNPHYDDYQRRYDLTKSPSISTIQRLYGTWNNLKLELEKLNLQK